MDSNMGRGRREMMDEDRVMKRFGSREGTMNWGGEERTACPEAEQQDDDTRQIQSRARSRGSVSTKICRRLSRQRDHVLTVT